MKDLKTLKKEAILTITGISKIQDFHGRVTACQELLDILESLELLARGAMADTLEGHEGESLMISGLPYNVVSMAGRGAAKDGAPKRLALRCAISASVRAQFDLVAKTEQTAE